MGVGTSGGHVQWAGAVNMSDVNVQSVGVVGRTTTDDGSNQCTDAVPSMLCHRLPWPRMVLASAG